MSVDRDEQRDHEVRNDMKTFWNMHSTGGTLEEMMLDSQASSLTSEELPEILALLPNMENKKILELGAGIGRFTGIIAAQAKHVTAVDFMDKFVQKNKENNKNHTNIDYMTADVTKLSFKKNSFDFIFSNWLLMYLSNEEVRSLAGNMLAWLKEGGCLFFRESCFYQSGDAKRVFNPTNYRSPELYNGLFRSVSVTESDNKLWGFDIIFMQSLKTYIKLKQNHNQICWLMEKLCRDLDENHGFLTFQDFLDSNQYSKQSILRYEKIFGDGYISTGGPETTKEFVKMLNLQPGQRILDAGCGIGGGDFYMSREYKVHVLGTDLSSNMVEIALERAKDENDVQVEFEVGDITKRRYPPESFDVVYSRDTILHIKDKLALFKHFLTWLKPGGKLLISDYCCADPPHSNEFQLYVKQRGYTLYTPNEYGQLLQKAGFINVRAEDRSQQFVDILKSEREKVSTMNKEDFLKDFTEEDLKYLLDGWNSKLKRVGDKDQSWGLFYADKSN